jgi:hypothetical protein
MHHFNCCLCCFSMHSAFASHVGDCSAGFCEPDSHAAGCRREEPWCMVDLPTCKSGPAGPDPRAAWDWCLPAQIPPPAPTAPPAAPNASNATLLPVPSGQQGKGGGQLPPAGGEGGSVVTLAVVVPLAVVLLVAAVATFVLRRRLRMAWLRWGLRGAQLWHARSHDCRHLSLLRVHLPVHDRPLALFAAKCGHVWTPSSEPPALARPPLPPPPIRALQAEAASIAAPAAHRQRPRQQLRRLRG